MKDRWVTDPVSGKREYIRGQMVTPEGLTKLMEKFMVITGGVSNREANVGLNVSVGPEQLPADVLRGLRQLAIAEGAGTATSGQSPLPGSAGPKPVGAPVARTVGN